MFKYKRKINEINYLHKSSFVTSDKVNTTICLNSDFTVRKPFNGLYIKNGKVIISNLFEQIETKENKYSINNIIYLFNILYRFHLSVCYNLLPLQNEIKNTTK